MPTGTGQQVRMSGLIDPATGHGFCIAFDHALQFGIRPGGVQPETMLDMMAEAGGYAACVQGWTDAIDRQRGGRCFAWRRCGDHLPVLWPLRSCAGEQELRGLRRGERNGAGSRYAAYHRDHGCAGRTGAECLRPQIHRQPYPCRRGDGRGHHQDRLAGERRRAQRHHCDAAGARSDGRRTTTGLRYWHASPGCAGDAGRRGWNSVRPADLRGWQSARRDESLPGHHPWRSERRGRDGRSGFLEVRQRQPRHAGDDYDRHPQRRYVAPARRASPFRRHPPTA